MATEDKPEAGKEEKATEPPAKQETKEQAEDGAKKEEAAKKDEEKAPTAAETAKPAAASTTEAAEEAKPAPTKAETAPSEQPKEAKQGETTASTPATEGAAAAPAATGDNSNSKPHDRGPRNARRHQGYRNTGGGGEGNEGDRNRRVYVGNLAWEVSWHELKDLMKSTGHDVTRADIMMTPEGRSKGCGIVEFATAEGAQQAVATLNDTELMGRQIFVREDREDRNSGGGFAPRNAGGGSHRFSSGEQAQSRRVYVGNLSWDVAWQDLKDHMRQAGDVVHAEVICEHNGRSKGCGIVEFATDEAAKEAIKTLTDTELKGRMIFVREDRETASGSSGGPHAPGGRSQSTSVYVWNLSYETTWQELKDHMRKAGNVDQATILTDPEGQSIGCGVVVYQRSHEAARAIRELQDSELKGRPMHLREDRVQSGHGYGHGGRGYGGRGHGGRGRGHYGGRHHHGGGGHHGEGSEGCQVFVGNLSFETTWRELKDHFRQCGDVERADVKFADGKSRGFGTVRFYKSKDAETAISRLNGVELQGRALEVRLDQKA